MSQNTHIVRRPFPHIRPLRAGDLVDARNWRNRALLEKGGYIRPIYQDEVPTETTTELPIEVAETEIPAIDETRIQQTAPDEVSTEGVQEVQAEEVIPATEETETVAATEEQAVETGVEQVAEETPVKEAPKVQKGDTIKKLARRYTKPELLVLAESLKVKKVTADNNEDEIAEKILTSPAAQKFLK